jgi:CO/xanthine dehydrogenase Mo-binding subunit
MEPVNCTAQVKDGKVRLWAPTQSPGFAVDGRPRWPAWPKDVVLTVTMLGGGFGRRLDVDMVAQAVAIAKQADGYPVQLIWSAKTTPRTTSTVRHRWRASAPRWTPQAMCWATITSRPAARSRTSSSSAIWACRGRA